MNIKSISLKNFRGIREEVSLETHNKESVLLYGENGSGKSSFLDAVEWFTSGKVSRLSGDGIERKHDGLKNIRSNQREETFVEIAFTSNFKNKKKLEIKNDRYKAFFESDNKIESVLEDLKRERLWIRNNELLDFIIKTKTDRLSDISDIIGYDMVKEIKKVLKKSLSALNKIRGSRNFENSMAAKKAEILKNLGQTVNNKEQFYNAVSSYISDLIPGTVIKNRESLNNVIDMLASSTDSKELEFNQLLREIDHEIKNFLIDIDTIIIENKDFLERIGDIRDGFDNLKNLSLIKLYDAAEKILSYHKDDNCPLCLSQIKKEDLLEIISQKLKRIEKFKDVLKSFKSIKSNLYGNVKKALIDIRRIEDMVKKVQPGDLDTHGLIIMADKLNLVSSEIEKDIDNVSLDKALLKKEEFLKFSGEAISFIQEKLKSSNITDATDKINLITKVRMAEKSFDDLCDLEKEKNALEKQYSTLKQILTKLASMQKAGMSQFLNEISDGLNKYYKFMYDGNGVDGITFKMIDNKEGDFTGIVFDLKFHGEKTIAPIKFLCESSIRCLGLSLFLSSVKIFNKRAKFFILDDVISSFDRPHRYRFGQLLKENFSDYQLFVFTHEKEWFDWMSSMVKGKGWHINEVSWNDQFGTQVKIPLTTFREKINSKIQSSDVEGFGNLSRKYAENILKKLSSNLNIELPFKLNESNENRTIGELYSYFRKKIKEKSNIAEKTVIKRLEDALFLENRASHDSNYRENLADMKSISDDLISFEDIFKCVYGSCKNFVSEDYYNQAECHISCKCGNKKLYWK